MSDYTDSSNPTQAGRDLCATGRHHFEDGGPCLRCSEPAPLDGAPSGETPSVPREEPQPATFICDICKEDSAEGDWRGEHFTCANCRVDPPEPAPSGQALEALTELRKHFEDRGLCHILEKRGACDCPLCLIDRVRAALSGLPQPPNRPPCEHKWVCGYEVGGGGPIPPSHCALCGINEPGSPPSPPQEAP